MMERTQLPLVTVTVEELRKALVERRLVMWRPFDLDARANEIVVPVLADGEGEA